MTASEQAGPANGALRACRVLVVLAGLGVGAVLGGVAQDGWHAVHSLVMWPRQAPAVPPMGWVLGGSGGVLAGYVWCRLARQHAGQTGRRFSGWLAGLMVGGPAGIYPHLGLMFCYPLLAIDVMVIGLVVGLGAGLLLGTLSAGCMHFIASAYCAGEETNAP